MMNAAARRFAAVPTAGKLLLILTALLLPIGIALSVIGASGIRDANNVLRDRETEDARSAARAVESLIARNALALRIAAAAALADGTRPCDRAVKALSTAPGISHSFGLRDRDGAILCAAGGFLPRTASPLVKPGEIRVWIDPDTNQIDIRIGIESGMATASVTEAELRQVALDASSGIRALSLIDGSRRLELVAADNSTPSLSYVDMPIANGALVARVGVPVTRLTTLDQLLLLLPVLMWVLAALVTWLLVTRLLIRPLRQLQRAVSRYTPGDELSMPEKLGPATEIQELRDAFGRAIVRVDESEREMTAALEGQRKLVREVHHRVKNNLQVVASLLNIHGRSAETPDARAAYAGIARRVGALSIVHRNHFAEMEENRGIALRPLLSELAAELRAGAPDPARKLGIDLELESVNTTQDVAVAVAFLITEIVEFAMLNRPEDSVELSLRRTSPLTARLTLSSPVLVPEEEDRAEKIQFERIIGGLAKQLRSTLDRKLGRYSVDLPVFPPY
ncbi:MAG TPA: sensor histidine kinase [Sphingomicrobium sp.]|nr:sensor histidine kinase [Sphingomicrobium sp.]